MDADNRLGIEIRQFTNVVVVGIAAFPKGWAAQLETSAPKQVNPFQRVKLLPFEYNDFFITVIEQPHVRIGDDGIAIGLTGMRWGAVTFNSEKLATTFADKLMKAVKHYNDTGWICEEPKAPMATPSDEKTTYIH